MTKAPRKSQEAARVKNGPVPKSIINYSAEKLVTLVFSNSKETATTHVAPMDIADVRTILLSKLHNFPFDAMQVFGPNGEIMEVRAWWSLRKTYGWRSGARIRPGSAATGHIIP